MNMQARTDNRISSIKSLTLDLPPSCIAFCPQEPRYFVVGTYFLHPQEQQEPDAGSPREDAGSAGEQQVAQKRSGSLILFRLDGDSITHVVTTETDYAVLDVQWTLHIEVLGSLLAVATSTGSIVFYRLETNTSGAADLVFSCSKAVADPSVLVLSVAWHPGRAHVIGLTLSNGNVSLCESVEGKLWSEDAVVYLNDIHQHELEAWILAFSGSQSTNVLSGGDDAILQYSHINGLQERAVLWRDRKLHEAGVTAILPLASDLVVTGSYDDHIRLIYHPPVGRRQVLAEHNLGGGVWRLKCISPDCLPLSEGADPTETASSESKSLVILASCMHAGSRAVRLCKGGDGTWSFEVIASFEEHKSMNYGSDVQASDEPAKSIISISFYDKLLCLWRLDLSTTEHAQ